MYWYVLFIRAGQEEQVKLLLEKRLDAAVAVPFIPMLETLFKSSGKVTKELKPLFPGYIFIESGMSSLEFMESVGDTIVVSKDII